MQHLLIVADILLHVAGLAVVSNQVPNACEPGVRIIMPRVHYNDPFRAEPIDVTPATRFQAPSPHANHIELVALPEGPALAPSTHSAITQRFPHTQPPHVQDHVAMLIFKTVPNNPVSANWPVLPLLTDPGYSYVKLDGDYIRFETGVTNPTPINMNAVTLPNLKTGCCAQMNTLKKEFLPPYQGAAAVFDLREGSLTTCDAPTSDGGRRDSEILMQDGGYVKISVDTMTSSKFLRFQVPAGTRLNLIAANLPAAYLSGNRTTPPLAAPDGRPHFFAYYDMGGGQSAMCVKSLTQWWAEHPSYAGGCKMTQFGNFAGIQLQGTTGTTPGTRIMARGPTSPNSPQGSNFECSNSQWP